MLHIEYIPGLFYSHDCNVCVNNTNDYSVMYNWEDTDIILFFDIFTPCNVNQFDEIITVSNASGSKY